MLFRSILSLLCGILLDVQLGFSSEGTQPRFSYQEQEHGYEDRLTHLGVIYGVTWVLYPLVQPDVMLGKKGSWEEFRENFGKTTFDQDEPYWNWLVHPLSGSQLYLFYRAMGYDRPDSFVMTFVSSALFEYTVEIYSEPASIQDLYQTPVIGSSLGYGIELLSTRLLNQESQIAQFFGRLINPLSYIANKENTAVVPMTDFRSKFGLRLTMDL